MAGNKDEGLGIVEIVISMFLFLLLAVAFLPLLINGLKVTASNATLATATQLADNALQQARALSGQCSGATGLAKQFSKTIAGATGSGLSATYTVNDGAIPSFSCPASFPVTVKVKVDVTGPQKASATTIILVTG